MKASKVGSLSVTFYFTYSDSTTSASVLTNFRTQYSGRLVYLLAFVLRVQEVSDWNLALKMTFLTEGLYDYSSFRHAGQYSKLITITSFEVSPNHLPVMLLGAVRAVQLIKRR